ncbi:SusD/RagB family nutrient-binding outer membrane lipoprotein [Tellurirhabdus bombi]|uniref:SusD/RagB family nutrient-binding outer membrane lipoprotein n=1 Tax=Tellurirhabdus bombi TaxID=2907205 RepID=UPI001F247FE6|nr:SusD/RagB family nutrient-binding outer membrane lipoprotein [Tellurirhabdus bombi]
MKKILVSFLATVLITSACQKQMDEYNVNPNQPEEASAALLLSGAEVATFAAVSGNLSIISAILVQQAAGNQEQLQTYGRYILTEADITGEWRTLFNGTIINGRTLIDRHGAGNPYYVGMTKILMAFNLGLATDFWGDVPTAEAGRALDGNFTPKYEKQEEVLKYIQTQLDEAIADLNKPATANVSLPGADDLIFGGNTKAWVNAAYIIKARYANRLSQIDPQGSANQALQFLSHVSADQPDFEAKFFDVAGSYNQWYDFISARPNYVRMGKFFIDYLKNTNDPRLPFFATKDEQGGYTGQTPEQTNLTTGSFPGEGVTGPDAPIPMATYAEAKFIEAEAQLRLGKGAEAAAAFNVAVAASVQRVTEAAIPALFKQAVASETAASITLEKIINQKYVALFTQPEGYHDWRRTGFPKLTPNQNSQQKAIPVRFPTSQEERNYNPNAVVIGDIYQPVWWDK